MQKIVFLLLTFFFFGFSEIPQKNFSSESHPLEKQIQFEMQKYNIPGLSISVIKDFETVWIGCFGWADKKAKRPVCKNTLFQAASISKPITASATLLVFNQKGLSLNSDVNEYLHRWKLPKTRFETHPVTVKQLLSHTSGISSFRHKGYVRGAKMPSLLESLQGRAPANTPPIEIAKKPGTTFEYAPSGYTVIQLLLEEILHCSFAQLMRTEILDPLSMDCSTFIQPLPKSRIQDIALPYDPKGKVIPGGSRAFPESASGGLWSTASELASWVISIQKPLGKNQSKLFTRKMVEEMLTPTPQNPHWGLGFEVGLDQRGKEVPNGNYFGHGGWNTGYLSRFLANGISGDGVVILVNSAPYMTSKGQVSQWEFIEKVTEMVGNFYNWPK